MKDNIEIKIAELLFKSNKTLSIAESCTGGLVSSIMTDVSGSSAYTAINFVTYSNSAKMRYLGVKESTLEKFGAVSSQTAQEMALGLIANTDADFALATTGIAGPTGGSKEKPVGLIYIGAASKYDSKVLKKSLEPNLDRIVLKKEFAHVALEFLYEFIIGELDNE